jgi:hypothetical protein
MNRLQEAGEKLASVKGKRMLQTAAPSFSKTLAAFRALDPQDVSLANLHKHLHVAMLLELATIPTYLSAMYTIMEGDSNAPDYAEEFGDNFKVQEIIRTVLVEEMLHLTLSGNVLTAVGGVPKLICPDFVPEYPTQLPGSSRHFWINLGHFSKEQIETFVAIEFPTPKGHPRAKLTEYMTIGQLYNGIIDLMELLEAKARKAGKTIFTGNIAHQVGPEHYYNSGGEIIVVKDLSSARNALKLIIEQGEGTEDDIWENKDNQTPVSELAHYYKFLEILCERQYSPTQTNPNELPQGEPLHVKWDKVFPMKANVKTDEYPKGKEGEELRAKSKHFNESYGVLLEMLQAAFTGHQEKLREAIMVMFKLKYSAIDLMRTPFPGLKDTNAGPSFEYLGKGDPKICK